MRNCVGLVEKVLTRGGNHCRGRTGQRLDQGEGRMKGRLDRGVHVRLQVRW